MIDFTPDLQIKLTHWGEKPAREIRPDITQWIEENQINVTIGYNSTECRSYAGSGELQYGGYIELHEFDPLFYYFAKDLHLCFKDKEQELLFKLTWC